VRRLRHTAFLDAARALGARTPRILFVHLLPNAVAPVIVNAAFAVAGAILLESALSFLGVGVREPQPSWGGMLGQGREHVEYAPHLVLLPGLMLFVVVAACHALGEALRDALDPRLAEAGR
jgi:peptide/nickel transport system permease protein